MTEVKTKSFSIKMPKMLKTAAPDFLSMMLWGVICFGASKAFVFGRIAPFGVAAAASSKRNCALPAALGAILGYIFSDKPENTLRYIAAVLMVFGAKLVFERFAEGDAVPVLISAAATAFASFGYAAMTVISGYGSLMALAETVLCAGAAYFFKRTEEAFEHGKNLSLLSSGDRACVIMTAAIAATSLIGVTFGKLSLGGIAACFAVLFSARYGRENGGSVSGVAVGTATSLAEGFFGFGFAGYALGGLVSGIFSVFGKIGSVLSFVAIKLMICLLSSEFPDYVPVWEAVIASGILMLIPEKAGNVISSSAFCGREKNDSATVKDLVLSKIGRAADGLLDISTATKKVAESVAKENSGGMSMVLNSAA
ncbi:MAG: hypothetical protein IIU57_04110, partial [Oscillospiraceae bacterium]|nr:hypothetical protein [Oscillospiraceae bacterium]